MQIQVSINGDDPVTYRLKQGKNLIGSGEQVQINIPSSAGISRKHAEITVEGETVFVADLGSTNGTFINEERLVPGSRKELTSFFPLRLADDVIVTLVTDDDAPAARESSLTNLKLPTKEAAPAAKAKTGNTSTILLNRNAVPGNSAMKAKIDAREKGRQGGGKGKEAPKKKSDDKSRMKLVYLLLMVGIGGAATYKFYLEPLDRPIEESMAPVAPPVPKPIPKISPLIPESEWPSKPELMASIDEIRCATDIEKQICDIIPDSTLGNSGATSAPGRIIVLLQEPELYSKSLELIPEVSMGQMKDRTAIIFLLLLAKLKPWDWAQADKNIFFTFYRPVEGKPTVMSSIGIKSSEIAKLMAKLPQDLEKEFKEVAARNLPTYREHFVTVMETSVYTPPVKVEPVPAQAPAAAQTAAATPQAPAPSPAALTAPGIATPPGPPPMLEVKPVPLGASLPRNELFAREQMQRARAASARSDDGGPKGSGGPSSGETSVIVPDRPRINNGRLPTP